TLRASLAIWNPIMGAAVDSDFATESDQSTCVSIGGFVRGPPEKQGQRKSMNRGASTGSVDGRDIGGRSDAGLRAAMASEATPVLERPCPAMTEKRIGKVTVAGSPTLAGHAASSAWCRTRRSVGMQDAIADALPSSCSQ